MGYGLTMSGIFSELRCIDSSVFKFIKWEDDEPYKISELLKED